MSVSIPFLTHRYGRVGLALLTVPLLAASCQPGNPPTIPPPRSVGAFVPRLANITIRTSAAGMVTEAQALHATIMRTEQDITAPTTVPERAAFDRAGIATLLTIRDNPQPGPLGKPTVVPPHTPETLDAFRTDLARTLDADRPAVVAVENEEVGSPFVSGTASDYLAELAAAIDVAHARNIPVTNGGLVSSVAALLTWEDLARHQGKAAADDFARRAFSRANQRKLLTNLLASTDGTIPPGPSADNLAKAHELVAGYAALPLDYVNFHWYIDDDEALRQTVVYLRAATGHPVITHEIGQYTQDPNVVTGHLATLAELKVPIVIWFDADGDPAVGLHDAPGVLRDTGIAFAASAR
jgi:hypothetical protein